MGTASLFRKILVLSAVVLAAEWRWGLFRTYRISQPETTSVQFIPPAQSSGQYKFYLLEIPEITTLLTETYPDQAKQFYKSALSEESAELWLHRGLQQHPDRVPRPTYADIVIVPAYLHLNHHLRDQPGVLRDWQPLVQSHWVPGRPHVVACPTWNPQRSTRIGILGLSKLLKHEHVYYSLGFERNEFWQRVPSSRIIPIPYVVDPNGTAAPRRTVEDGIFYAGDPRPHAAGWSGCNRTHLLHKLLSDTPNNNTEIRLVSKTERLEAATYNRKMASADYCLIVCGDTPTSRTLTAAITALCIPIFVGSRWRGECDHPCHSGWGWNPADHRPYRHRIPWDVFPEVDEARFAEQPQSKLDQVRRQYQSRKVFLRRLLRQMRSSFVYGSGSPVDSNDVGEAVAAVWQSIVEVVLVEKG